MATEPNTVDATQAQPVSVIENEIPAYRAISALALTSLGLGLLSALSFANSTFLIAAALAVGAGAWADWRIRRYSDVLTGRGYAQAGIALGLIFGLSSVTTAFVSSRVMKREAESFGRHYAKELAKGDLAVAMWYHLPVQHRSKESPREVIQKMRGQGGKDAFMSFQTRAGATQALLDRLKAKDAHLEFDTIEVATYDGLTPVATARLEVHGPAVQYHPAEEFALVEIKGDRSAGGTGWYVSELHYPYKPNTLASPVKQADSHGHSH